MRTPIRKPQPNLRDLARAVGELCDRVQELQILQSPSTKINWTRNGTIIEVKREEGGASQTSDDARWS